MRKTVIVALTLGLFLFSLVATASAQGKAAKGQAVEKTGVLEVQPPGPKQKYATVLLKVGKEVFKLLPAKTAKDIMPKLEAMNGKEVTVKGNLLPADAKHPLPAISITSFTEATAATPAAAPAPAAEPTKGN
ncbi:MAG: hypothetical protein GX442_21535 [Candidatus Riflebacteria bacterium]|nr:hypothetical protein [Candidatus Riflebacteria bacterium]